MIHIEINDSTPQISVIVPAYNAERFIGQTIDSLVKQMYKDFELIIINDGSTDNTKKIIDQFSFDRRIRYFEKENGGTGSALNLGHKYARGKHITWCSSDNIYMYGFLHLLSTVLSNTEKRGIHFIYSDFCYIDATNKKLRDVLHKHPQPKEDFINGYDIGISFMYTKWLWDNVGDYWNDICEDFNWVVRAGQYTDFALVQQVLAAFRVHESQITGSNTEREKAAATKCKELASKMVLEGKYHNTYVNNFNPNLVEG